MGTARREFLRAGVLSCLAVATPFSAVGAVLQSGRSTSTQTTGVASSTPVGDYKINPESQRTPLDSVTQAMFAAQLNTRFQFLRVNSSVAAQFTLTKVFDFKANSGTAHTTALTDESFALTFRAEEEIGAEQKIYTLVHETIGMVELFLVPDMIDGRRFEAVINRLHA